MLVGSLAVAMAIGAFLWLNHIASDNINHALVAAVFALTCVVAWSTFGLAIFTRRLTKRILRAIDLAP
jgi:hypothetical protein